MRALYLFSSLLLMAFVHSASAQSIYHFQYSFRQPGDTAIYHAFFARYDDGSGLLRVRYTSPVTGELVLVEMDTEERYAADTVSSKTDTSRLLIYPSSPRFIIGNSSVNFQPPCFEFTYRAAGDLFEPTGVGAGPSKIMSPNTYFSAALVESSGLNKEFVSAFFSEDEDFYVNLFKTGGRGLTNAEKNTTLFLLAVGDTMDASIGGSCSRDLRRAQQTFKDITNYLGIHLVVNTISGATYSKKNVQSALARLKPLANDIVVFYYSGHGFRLEGTRRFPNIKLKTNHTSRQDVLNNSLNMEDIFMQIKKKGARCNLVLSDCCNNDIETTNSIGVKPGKTKSSGIPWDEDNCRSLFLNKTPVSVLATAADNGQRASGNNDFGGFFSYFFTVSMENHCSKFKSKVNWDLVLEDAKMQTINKAKHTYCDKPYIPENICSQFPYYIVR